MNANAGVRLRELTLAEAVAVSGGDCTLQYHLGRAFGSAVRAVVDFGRGVRDGLGGK